MRIVAKCRWRKASSVFLIVCLFLSLTVVRPSSVAAAEFIPEDMTYTVSVIAKNGNELENGTKMFEGIEARTQTSASYSVINTWPTKSYLKGKGVSVMDLLKEAGVKWDKVKQITFTTDESGSGGYAVTFTVEELFGNGYANFQDKNRLYYPNLIDGGGSEGDGAIAGSTQGGKNVGAILALPWADGMKLTTSVGIDDGPMLMVGQRYVTEQNYPWYVKQVRAIVVSSDEPEQANMPVANIPSGEVEAGTVVTLSSVPFSGKEDAGKVYYTTDGKMPTIQSAMFNLIGQKWLADRTDVVAEYNKPIEINKNTTIKAINVQPGLLNSEVAEFTYTVKSGSGVTGGKEGDSSETGVNEEGTTDLETSGSVGTGDGQTTTPTLVSGGARTDYNNAVLANLNKATAEQARVAHLRDDAPRVNPDGTTAFQLMTKDGLVQLLVPPEAVSDWSEPAKMEISLGEIQIPPQADQNAIVLDPLKFQRKFEKVVPNAEEDSSTEKDSITDDEDSMTKESLQFSAPVTISFLVGAEDLPEGITLQQLAIYWWDPVKEDWINLGGVCDEAAGTISLSTYHCSTYAVMADAGSAPGRLAGIDHYATANVIADQGWKTGADNVVLVNGDSFPDALAAGPLAYKLNAPILLTDAESLTPTTWTEMQKLGSKTVTLIGGTTVISQDIEDTLSEAYGEGNVVRYSGVDRYGTAAAVASALGMTGKAVVANGENGHYTDALAIAPYAAYYGIPILFTKSTDLPGATSQTLMNRNVRETIVVGGSAVIPDDVYNRLPGAVRYAGEDCYETAAAVAVGLNMNKKQVYVVSGLGFSDALVAGNLASRSLAPIIMLDEEIPGATSAFLTANKAAISGLTVVGGEGVITSDQERAVRGTLN